MDERSDILRRAEGETQRAQPQFAGLDEGVGLEQASHNGGCGLVYGFGSTTRGGTVKYFPRYSYVPSCHMRGICSSDSRHIGFVSAADGMQKPAHSAEEEPRPVPNSTRPSDK